MSKIGLSIIKLLGTEFINNQCEHYFSFACPGSIIRVILLDTVSYVIINVVSLYQEFLFYLTYACTPCYF